MCSNAGTYRKSWADWMKLDSPANVLPAFVNAK